MLEGAYKFPIILGHELSGEIVEKGEEVTNVQIGNRVTVIPLIPCRVCPLCELGEYPQCDNYDYLGSRRDGGFAEYVVVPSVNVVQLPKEIDYESAALTEPAAVALHAVRRTGIDAGDKVAILGAGPVGLLLAQWSHIMGAGRVFLTDILKEKLALAGQLGFEDCINASEEDPVERVKEETEGLGADISFEAAGSAQTLEMSLRTTRKLGKVVWVGNVGTDVTIPKATLSLVLRNQLTIYGSWNSNFSALPKNEWQTTLQFMHRGLLKASPLISHRFPLSQAKEAFEMMFENREFFNKVLLILD